MLFFKVNSLDGGKKVNRYIWDILLLVRRTFLSGEDINIPSDKVLTMHSPTIDGELYIDGEAFIE